MLYRYAEKYEMLYKQPKKDILTVACGCIVAQQVSFNIGRNIRKQLFELCGHPVDKDLLLSVDLTQIKNLTENRIKLLKEIAQINHDQSDIDILECYKKLPGFGKWTTGAISILLDLDDSINLSSDS